MTCGYCGYRNGADDHRCRRCGRRPDDAPVVGPFAAPRTDGALAAAPAPQPAVAVAEPLQNADYSRASQPPLFHSRPASNVIPFESYAGARVEAQPRPQTDVPRRASTKTAARRAPSREIESQGSLDFLPISPAAPRTLGTTVEAVISCESPVATTLHRAVAGALDWSMVLIGYGLFLLSFRIAGGAFVLTRSNLMVFAAGLPLVAFAYGLIWTIAGSETPGMHWTQLRLTTFEGFPLTSRHRLLRFAGSCLSLCTGIGLLWALADEENLNWQDHISRTFPTPVASDTQVFHRL